MSPVTAGGSVVTGQWVGVAGEAVGWSVELSVMIVVANPNLILAKLCNAIMKLRKLANRAHFFLFMWFYV